MAAKLDRNSSQLQLILEVVFRMTPGQQVGSNLGLLHHVRRSFAQRLDKTADFLESHPQLLVSLLFLFYLRIVKGERVKPLWHDELFTYYIAQAPSFAKMMEWTRTIDLNPPLYYTAARLTFHFLRPGDFSVRLPSIVAYFVATLCLYQFVRRRLTALYGFLAAMVMLASSFNIYSYEARPYAMVLCFLGILALAWQRAIEEDRPRSWIALFFVVFGGFGMLLSHVLASIAYAALLLTELIRFLSRRKPDWILWICLALPLSACVTYLQPIQNHSSGSFPPKFQASIVQLFAAYSDLWIDVASLLGVAIIAIVLLTDRPEYSISRNSPRGFSWPEKILALDFACVPLVVVLVFMHSHSAFFTRYGIPAIFGVGVLVAWFVARWTAADNRAALICSIAFVFGVVAPSSIARHLQNFVQPNPGGPGLSGEPTAPFASVMPDLPFVDASGLTFLEMNHRESSEFLSRVYYLTDAAAAVKYAHATIFEGFPVLKHTFPIEGNVVPYQQFIREHPRFLVFGTYNYAEDWLLRKLVADGATVRLLGNYQSNYRDHQLYEVTAVPQ